MAIDAQVENEYGAKFAYHKLREVRIINDDKNGIQLAMTVYSWLDKQARIEGRQPTVRQCIIQDADFALQSFYALLKAKFPEFNSGKDDFDNSHKEEHERSVSFIEQTAQGKLLNRWAENDQKGE